LTTVAFIFVGWAVGSIALGWLFATAVIPGHGSTIYVLLIWFFGLLGFLIHLLLFFDSRRRKDRRA
jgi:hypothetical protein